MAARAVTAKWALAADATFTEAVTALNAGDLAAAERSYVEAEHGALSRCGLGDLAAIRGDWAGAADEFQRALAIEPGNPVARIGLAQAMVADGRAMGAVAVLEGLLTERPDDPVVRLHLAGAWFALAGQVRDLTGRNELVITNARQLDTCERAAQRVLALDTGDPALTAGAQALLAEIAHGRVWRWRHPQVAVLCAGATVLVGLLIVVGAGLSGSVFWVVAAGVLGALALFGTVLWFRRPRWELLARDLAPRVWQPGSVG